MKKLISLSFGPLLLASAALAQQPGEIIVDPKLTPTPTYAAMLDPNGDGYITKSDVAPQTPFSSGTTEAAEFEVIPNAVSGWIEIFDVAEANGDITPACSNVDIVEDADGGGIGYWTTVDPTPTAPTSGDETILFRVRIANRYSGNFGYNFLVSNDGLYGAADANAIPGNRGFEVEVQFSSGGNDKGVSAWDIDNATAPSSIACASCVALDDVQQAQAFVAGGCTSGAPTFVTFPLPLSYLGVGSDVDPVDLFIGLATAASGNNTSILGGGNVKDYGAFDDTQNATTCPDESGAGLFDCLMAEAYVAQQTALPVTLVAFAGERVDGVDHLAWAAVDERDFDRYDVERSGDGRTWSVVGSVAGAGADGELVDYAFAYAPPAGVSSYYRLRAVDLDGTADLSRVIAVAGPPTRGGDLTAAPNPTLGLLRVGLADAGAGATYALTAADGREVRRGPLPGAGIVLDVADLPAGAYGLNARDGGRLIARRVVIR